MSTKNLVIDLKKVKDNDGNWYYVGKLDTPVLIDCSKGVAFLIFTSEDGSECMQIAKDTSKDRQPKQNQSNGE